MSEFVITDRMRGALIAAEGLAPTPANIDRVRREFGPDANWGFTQWQLRAQAKQKFAKASQMLFTRAGLEMASHEVLAAWRARRFGDQPVTDATAGIGGDAIALAARGRLVAVEPDPESAAYLEHNLAIHGLTAEILRADGIDVLRRSQETSAFADPMRRSGRTRLRDPDQFSPPAQTLAELMSHRRVAMIKLSPLSADEFLMSLGGDVEFVSYGRECREALICYPGRGQIRAVHVESGDSLTKSVEPPVVDHPADYLYEVDPAAIRAPATGTFGIPALGDARGYLTYSSRIESPWLTGFRVLWYGSWREKEVRAAIIQSGRSIAAVKKRGIDLEPRRIQALFRKLEGDAAELILYPSGDKIRAVLAERISRSDCGRH